MKCLIVYRFIEELFDFRFSGFPGFRIWISGYMGYPDIPYIRGSGDPPVITGGGGRPMDYEQLDMPEKQGGKPIGNKETNWPCHTGEGHRLDTATS